MYLGIMNRCKDLGKIRLLKGHTSRGCLEMCIGYYDYACECMCVSERMIEREIESEWSYACVQLIVPYECMGSGECKGIC